MLCKPGSETLHAETHPEDSTVSAAPDQWGSTYEFMSMFFKYIAVAKLFWVVF